MYFASIYEIEHLKHHKCVEYKCHMPRVHVDLVEYLFIVVITVDKDQPARPSHSILSILVRSIKSIHKVESIRELHQQLFAKEHQHQQ